ncbi:IS110 family transposase [Acidilutibacter cellobiosedens]|uniref:IS110 family transposase n=1 Tax=Acidilutibacter cellobiosedens TaxID=2507161 RepID=UPI0019808CD3|nr:transposase [Acidilutibacter cellobiosedens]
MSNILFQNLFISVGIDVGADFSFMSIALPNRTFVGKPFKILHSDLISLSMAVSKIKEAEEMYSLESHIFLESTGIYHFPLFCYLRDKGFLVSIINPIITKNSTSINIRKVHNDKFDSKKAALIGLNPDLKVSLIPSDLVLDLRNLSREYYDLMDNRSAYVNKLQGELRMVFPQFLKIFSKITAVSLMCEIGDFSAFQSSKQLFAYFGLDPAVKQSGNFEGTKISMSKRGSRIARMVLHTMALISISRNKDGSAKNPVLRDYYLKKCQSKPKMVALGAVMHKVCNIVFAILRDEKNLKSSHRRNTRRIT